MKVDVVIQTYGKPWQLLCTLSSLLSHSKNWIDKIYLIEEATHPHGDNINEALNRGLPIIHKRHNHYANIYSTPPSKMPIDLIRHQWGIEKSDKQWVFICHNDVLFTGDIIGNMLPMTNENMLAGIGQIGQCWNCPFIHSCGGGEKWNDWNPTWEEIDSFVLPQNIRTRKEFLDKQFPKLAPECRLNEFACLINREYSMKEGRPYFGEFGLDSGTEWFKAMHKRGYKFKDYRKDYLHGYWSPKSRGSGYESQINRDFYFDAESNAKKYFFENYQ